MGRTSASEHCYVKPEPRLAPFPRIERAEPYFAATGADIRTGGDRAYYAIGSDHIQMPHFETFVDAESYCAALAHETTHWTQRFGEMARGGGFVPLGIDLRVVSQPQIHRIEPEGVGQLVHRAFECQQADRVAWGAHRIRAFSRRPLAVACLHRLASWGRAVMVVRMRREQTR